MGIKGLKQFLRTKFPQCVKESHLYFYWGKKAAMDLLPYLYRYKVSHGEKWREGLFTLFTTFIKNNVHLTVIMDGPSVYKEKDKEREKRKQSRDKIKTKVEQLEADLLAYDTNGTITDLLRSLSEESSHRNLLLSVHKADTIQRNTIVETILKLKNQIVSITKEDIVLVKELCASLSIPFMYAKQEAESFSSYLCKTNQVDIVITEDTDVLAYGCPQWLSNIAHDGTCILIEYQSMLSEMKFTSDQFIDFCILCGTDYNETIRGLGPVSAYKLLSVHHTIEKSVEDTKELNQILLRQIFSTPCNEAVDSLDNPVTYSPTIYFNLLPKECELSFLFANSFKAWLRTYPDQFMLL